MTPERIAELRAILDADLLDQGTAFYMACDDLPSALDTIEAQAAEIELLQKRLREQFDVSAKAIEKQAARIEELEAALKDASSAVVAFAALKAMSAAESHGLPDGHLLPHHYDLLKKHGARMASFTRAKEPL